MRELLEYLVGALVEKPDAVKVEEFEEDDGTLVFELSVDDDDYGRIIGRGGRTAQALRTVVDELEPSDRGAQDHRARTPTPTCTLRGQR